MMDQPEIDQPGRTDAAGRLAAGFAADHADGLAAH